MNKVSKKIVLLGNEGVGKTSLSKRFVHSIFSDEYLSTIGIKISKKMIPVGDTEVTLMLWDVAGNMMNKTLYNNYLSGAHGVLLVCDASRPETYQNILLEKNDELPSKLGSIPSFTIVNKSDLIEGDPVEYLKDYDYNFLTSAKTGNQVEEAFYQVAKSTIIDQSE